jgi:RNA polymerase sigma factor (sigma-70 family)
MDSFRNDVPSGTSHRTFATTSWTVVREAGAGDTPQTEAALEKLCTTYWFPIYAYIRRRGHSKEDAEDLTQGFFARLLSRNLLDAADAERGRFRSFLLGALKHFLANEWRRSQCQKRGGQEVHLSIDWLDAEAQFQVAAAAGKNPDRVFDQEWAVALLARVIGRLGDECADTGRVAQFEELKVYLTVGKSTMPYAAVAKGLGIAEGGVRVAVHRLRRRYRELLRDEVCRTLSNPAQVEEEMKALFSAFTV